MTTIATLLSGGEGVGIGARAAGLRHLWGIECDPAIADVARANGFNLIAADVRDIDPYTLEAPDILHASPECQNASNAKQDPDAETFEAKETRLDVEIAGCIVRYLEVLQPRIFTLENVYGYRRFQSFRLILAALNRLGYFTHFANLNSADFGVPQTRRRLILRAVRYGLVPVLPLAERPWRGWYEATADILLSLRHKPLADWQLRIVRPEQPMLFDDQFSGDPDENGHRKPVCVTQDRPSFTITTRPCYKVRAYISDSFTGALSGRMYARLQSFPDSYILPGDEVLASRVIGNAVPPLMYQKIVAGLAT